MGEGGRKGPGWSWSLGQQWWLGVLFPGAGGREGMCAGSRLDQAVC